MSTMPFPMTLPGGDSSGVAAKSTGPRWALTATGFVVYFVLGVFVAMAIEPLVGAFTFPVRLAFGLVPAVVAAIRGATVAAVVKPDGLYVRNRWRQQTIPWSEVGSVDEVEFAWGPFLAVVALGVFGTALAFVVMASNAGRLGSTRASVSVYLVPVVSLLLGALVRHEPVVALAIVGCAIAVLGAYLTNRRRV